MRIEQAYISAGSNRSASCGASSSRGVIAYGAGQYVATWLPQDETCGVRETLGGHAGQVTALKILSESEEEIRLVSGDSAGQIRIWRRDANLQWTCLTSFTAHSKASISALAPCPGPGPLADCLLTGGSDGRVLLWRLQDSNAKLLQEVNTRGKLPLDLEVVFLPGSQVPLLVAGVTDKRIQLYTFQGGGFEHALSLEGHEDWVRCLSVTPYPSPSGSDLLLATGSQDNYIRLWRISTATQTTSIAATNSTGEQDVSDLLDEYERSLAGEGSSQLSTRAHVLSVPISDQTSGTWSIALEALLVGHDAAVNNVHWSPSSAERPNLLSASSDNSLIIWTPSPTSLSTDGIWVPEHRFGAVGGRGLGFFGALWGKEAKSVLAMGWNGGIEQWAEADGFWEARAAPTGHYGQVRGLSWSPGGDYLLSVSSDQTSRIHAPVRVSSSADKGTERWAEIARPQIHGYDMTDVVFVEPLRFVSAADEKVSRVFDAPAGFVESAENFGVISSATRGGARPTGATVPSLGLSNKAIGSSAAALDMPATAIPNQATDSIAPALTSLPTEEQLSTATLWPEIEKIYGHGYELHTLAASPDGSLIATACRASSEAHAGVRVVSTQTWELVGDVLSGHGLTVTRIRFRGDAQRILSVSRDRSWRVYAKKDEGYVLLGSDDKAHARMINDCCWSIDGRAFATASRDKTVKLWSEVETQEAYAVAETIKLGEAVESVDWTTWSGQNLLAAGTESGEIIIFSVITGPDGEVKVDVAAEIKGDRGHVGPVNRLAWRPRHGERGLQLASCSDDRSVRIYDILM